MTLLSETPVEDVFICEVSIDDEPTASELAQKGDALRVVVSSDTVERIRRAKEQIPRPQLRRRFAGESLSPAEWEVIKAYKNTVLKQAFDEGGNGFEFGCELAKFAIFRWGLGGGDIAELVLTLDANRPGTAGMIRRWATKTGRSRQSLNDNAYRHYR